MRASAMSILVLAVAGSPVAAQFSFGKETTLDTIATRFKLDFAIPESPAFSLLQVSTGSILRPGTVREVAALVSDFISSDGDFSVPKEFGFEFAPAMLLGGSRLSLMAYKKSPWLYRLRLSAAVKRTATAVNQLAVGVRVAVVDRADLRTNKGYLEDATALATAINDIFAEQNRETGPDTTVRELSLEDLSEERRAKVEILRQQLKKRVEDRDWNADILDVAAGLLAGSRDTTGNAIRLTQYAGWATYGKGLGRWGQLLLGLSGSAIRDTSSTKFKAAGSLGARLYGGVNQYKAFIETEGKVTGGDDEVLVNAGGEARLLSGGWVQFSSGIRWVGNEKPKLVGNLTFKLGALGL